MLAIARQAQQFTYRYEDTDTLMSELQDFFPYVELDPMLDRQRQNSEVYFGRCTYSSPLLSVPVVEVRTRLRMLTGPTRNTAWTTTPAQTRQNRITTLLHSLETTSTFMRLSSAKHLLYLLLGSYGETSTEEEQLHWAVENARMIRKADGVGVVLGGLVDVVGRHGAIA